MKNRLKSAEHRLNTGSKGNINSTKETTLEGIKPDVLWRVTNKSDTITRDGVKYTLCPHNLVACKTSLYFDFESIIDVRDLEMELEAITLYLGCNNNINKIISKMLTMYQEIHSRTGKHSYNPPFFVTNLFRATLTYPVEKYEAFVDQLKQRWIMEEITDE